MDIIMGDNNVKYKRKFMNNFTLLTIQSIDYNI